MQSCNLKSSQDNRSDDSSEHFFVPLSATGFSRVLPDKKLDSVKSRLFASQDPSVENRAPDGHGQSKYNELSHVLNDLDSFQEYDRVRGFLSAAESNCLVLDSRKLYYDMEEAHDQVFSPPLLMDPSLLGDCYEDLLGMLAWQQVYDVLGIHSFI